MVGKLTNEEFLPTRYIVNFLRRSQNENRQIMAVHLRRLIDAHGCSMARKCREHARYLGVYPNGISRRVNRGTVTLIDYV